MYRLPFELTDSAKLLHFTILGRPPVPPPLNDATDKKCDEEEEKELRHIFGHFGITVKWP